MSVALGVLLLIGVLWFGAASRAGSAAFQTGAFLLYAIGARWQTPPAIALGLLAIAAWGGAQIAFGWTVYAPLTEAASLRWLALAALAACSARAFRSRRLLTATLVAGAAISVLGLLQAATTDRLYWIVAARAGKPFGPFVNRDHFAVLMEILIPVALWQGARRGGSAWAGAGLAILFAVSAAATGSRAGAAIVLFELAVLGPLAWKTLRGEPLPWKAELTAAVAMMLAIAAAGWEPLTAKLADRDPLRGRREIAHAALALTAERPWTGHGLGTFETVYPSQAVFEANARIDHAHNDWLELTAEGGWPPAALWLGAAGLSAWRSRRVPWAWGAFAALVHALVDFPMQIPGLAGLIVALAAAGEGADRRHTGR